jgi:hypothetical protein
MVCLIMAYKFFVVRTYSHTDIKCLWKVLSRGLVDKPTAEIWMEHYKKEDIREKKYKPDWKYMIVEMLEEI